MTGIQDIQNKYSPEMALIILVCRVYFKRAGIDEIDRYVADNRIDWGLFEQIITAHQVRPFIFKVLAEKTANIPADFLAGLRSNCYQIATGNLRKLEELVRLHKLFKARGIPNIPYKGVLLSRLLFNDYISRETSDIDFLIDKKYFSRAHAIILNEGYKPRFYNPDFEKQFLKSSHELLYRKNSPAGAIKIEMHWAATSNMMSIPLPDEYLLAGLQTIRLQGEDIDIFDLQRHLLILLVHHGVNDVWRTLRHSIDLAVFIEKYSDAIDWDTFITAAKKYKINHTTAIGMQITRQLFGIEIPGVYRKYNEAPGMILDNLLRFPAIKKRKLNFKSLRQQMFLRDSFMDKIGLLGAYIYAGITPNVRDMEAYRLPGGWFVLYYFMKPFRIFFKGNKKRPGPATTAIL